MTDDKAEIDRVAALLLEHFGVKTERVFSNGSVNHYERFCTCGAPLPWSSDTMSATHRAHIAEVLVDQIIPPGEAGQ